MISVIIPAHNEARVIRRCLDQVTKGLEPGEADVIVVCNGCSDRTAEIARAFGDPVRVVETAIASKANALNLGDAAAKGFPRIYADADICLDGQGVRRIVKSLSAGPHLAAAPSMRMDFSRANWFVRAYYRVWTMLPYTREGFMGVGVYALSEEGRRRFDRFPDIIADDGYVRLLFASTERLVVPGCESVVQAPAVLRDLIKVKTRSRLGLYQLRREFPELFAEEAATKQYGAALGEVARRPSLWPCALLYLCVNMLSRRRARRQIHRIEQYVWERDESSRAAVGSDHCMAVEGIVDGSPAEKCRSDGSAS